MGTWTWDIARKEISWDESMATLVGHPVDEVREGNLEPVFSWIHPDDREAARAALEAAVRDKTKYEVQYRLVRPDGKVVWISARGRLEMDDRGNPRRMTGVCVDVTSQKMLQESLFQSQKMQALGTLAGGIAHDFNNIILAIGGNASLAIEDLAPDHPAMKSLQEISKASARASSLVRRILAFSRRQSANRKVLNLQPVVQEALGLLRSTLPARIEIRANFADGLPPISADSTQIHQVIMNLGTNAARAIGDANGTLEVNAVLVKIDAEDPTPRHRLKEGHYLRVSMSDTGCGMDKVTQERVFDPFFTTQMPGQGTGLGLSVVDGIMKDHEGSISLYSEPGKGTIFHLYFPAVVNADRVSLDAKESPPMPGNNERILYVDDEEALIRLASRALKKLGYDVTAFAHPAEALQAFRERPDKFDAVVTDISMQGMSGMELAQQLRMARPSVPIILTSGYIRKEDQEAASLLGINELVLKPDTIDELVRALQRSLSKQAK
jgi:PAS domain S-box-containing protein